MPLRINTYGSSRRMAMALGVDALGDIATELEGLITLGPRIASG